MTDRPVGRHELLVGDATKLPFSDETFHACVCDPPYGLAFMGKSWDQFEPKEYQEWCQTWAEEVLRVLKPGGHLLAFSGNRTHHRAFTGVEDAGFTVRDTITWHFGEGFPKGQNVGKDIDKRLGKEDEREVIGTRPQNDIRGGNFGTTESTEREEGDTVQYEETAPATDLAAKWEGWRSHLKPATEFVVLARKPLEQDTIVDQVMETGTGALNIDACRIGEDVDTAQPGGKNNEDIYGEQQEGRVRGSKTGGRYPANLVLDEETSDQLNEYEKSWEGIEKGGSIDDDNLYGNGRTAGTGPHEEGRYPANLALGEEAADQLDDQSGHSQSESRPPREADNSEGQATYSNDRFGSRTGPEYEDAGGASRFFYTSKAKKTERNVDGKIENKHPTCKPVDLMEWLVELVTAEDQLVLDPFLGSGTTVVACENTHRRCVGVDKQRKWVELSEKRIMAERGLLESDPITDW